MNKDHLTIEQRKAIQAAMARYPDRRPSAKEYETEQAVLRLVRVEYKPQRKTIKNTRPGFAPSEVVLLSEFNALNDMPAGWSVYSMYDSGGNHKMENAAVNVWRRIWNAWTDKPPVFLLDNIPSK